jgi:23S rRNA G2069 N7-methylase RlmK/C1962 C5-methylase RlmI
MLFKSITDNLAAAFACREQSGLLQNTDALHMFHGPGESQLQNAALQAVLKNLSIDRFGQHAWVTLWEEQANSAIHELFKKNLCAPLCDFLQQHFTSAVLLYRPLKGVPENPSVLFGAPPSERFSVHEGNTCEGLAKYWIQLQDAKHPGLFLDHAPLRAWLMQNSKGLRVLNTFAYTGSLSVAAAISGASHVTTLDLSKATMRWAEANGELNGLNGDRARWIAGDVFEWLPRLKKETAQGKIPLFDMVIMDPPSFSRSDKGAFSTAKDLPKLHELALDILAPGGLLITSINSAQISWPQFEKDILQAAKQKNCTLQVLKRLEQPETFPNWLHEQADERYLKGFILRVCRENK